MNDKTICYGCGALVDNIPGKPHRYIGAAQGCWNLYCEVLAKEYVDHKAFVHINKLTVDTYAIQHPGQSARQSAQSVNVHLLSLYAVLVVHLSGEVAAKLVSEMLQLNLAFEWLDPPVPNGNMTVADVLRTVDMEGHEKAVRAWADDVFGCWFAKHRQAIESLYDRLKFKGR